MADDPFVKLVITPDTGLGLILDSMEATEALGRPFTIVLDVSSDTPKGDLHATLGSSATITLTYPGRPTRHFNGLVARIGYRGLTGGAYRYRVELRPWIWLLSQEQDCRIFSGKSPWQIMTSLFRDAGFTAFADKRQNASGDTVLDYCVQYRETTLDFVTRLMEQYGLYYFVTHGDGSHTIEFADDPNSHASAGPAIPYRYDATDWRAADAHVWDWQADAQIQPGAYAVREYNFTTPKADLTAKSLIPGQHAHGTAEVYDYPGRYETADGGQAVAKVRMQDLATRRQVFGGTSNSRALGAGVKFTLSDFPDAAANGDYLVTESVCSVQRAETRSFQSDDEIIDTFRCVLRAVPGTRPFRLPDATPRPSIRGPQTARVAGEQGQEITTDKYGRIKVKFPWDRRAAEDENSSCWIRVAQGWAGQGWGSMFIPRIGQEVVVEFLEGNPDRPLVTGQVYNADMAVPYTLPDNKTRSTVKSSSSLHGGGFNEFRFEDKKGEEEVFFQAQKDFNEVILNNHLAKITKDTTIQVLEGDRTIKVQKGNQTTEVSTGNHAITAAAGSSTIEAAQKITLKVGSNSIEISQAGITIKALTIKLTADTTFEAAGATAKVAGSAMLELDGGAMAKLKAAIVMIN